MHGHRHAPQLWIKYVIPSSVSKLTSLLSKIRVCSVALGFLTKKLHKMIFLVVERHLVPCREQAEYGHNAGEDQKDQNPTMFSGGSIMFHCDKCNAAFQYPISLYSHKRANPNGDCIYVHGTNAGHGQNRRSVGRQENAFETAVLLSPTNNVTHPAAHTAQHHQTGQRRSREEFEAVEHEDDVDEQNLQADVDLEVWKFTTLCNNGMGLNGNDRLSLMALIRKLIQASRDHNIETTLTTIATHDSYLSQLAPGAHAGDSGTLSELLKNQPELLELPSKLTLFCSHDGAAVPTHINIVKSGVLASLVNPPRAFLWIDWLCMVQHHEPGYCGPDLNVIKSAIVACSHGIVMVMDPKLCIMSRLWCLYEVWTAFYHCSVVHVLPVFPKDFTIQDMISFESMCRNLNLSVQASCSKTQDKAIILSDIKTSAGLKRMQDGLKDGLLLTANRAALKQSGLKVKATYCGLLLSNGEYCRLQQVRNMERATYYEVKDMERATCYEVKDMERATCYEVKDMERATYYEINSDGKGGVSLPEFEAWFLASEKTKRKAKKKPVAMTYKSLLQNVERLVDVISKEAELGDLCMFFNSRLAEMRRVVPMHSGIQRPLPPAVLQGDWRNRLIDKVAWQIHTNKLKSAACLMNQLLLRNVDLLDLPTEKIKTLGQHLNQGQAELKLGLASALVAFASMINWNPEDEQTAAFLRKCGQEISATVTGCKKSSFFNGSKQVQFENEKFEIVRSMIKLKYGQLQPVQKILLVEAEISLGQWLANRKHVKNGERLSNKSLCYLKDFDLDIMSQISNTKDEASNADFHSSLPSESTSLPQRIIKQQGMKRQMAVSMPGVPEDIRGPAGNKSIGGSFLPRNFAEIDIREAALCKQVHRGSTAVFENRCRERYCSDSGVRSCSSVKRNAEESVHLEISSVQHHEDSAIKLRADDVKHQKVLGIGPFSIRQVEKSTDKKFEQGNMRGETDKRAAQAGINIPIRSIDDQPYQSISGRFSYYLPEMQKTLKYARPRDFNSYISLPKIR
ncbi:hypothetical protein CEUSTIGMA_g13193.t1 [Chlamydomonas eustigma]|uniref:Uncharacterized protein n=1 Tax=Chlamydomonas eustigma TaxID=1157962 RepID=A0A250XRU0_9CHLO|nr:hypothetical protein CEUSTIGMA_g13193.t1 [Chlamydomonas eustigma]|eukprot:GAX85778.1 hypothetical protein CEUSTIGMA_g13193.t1 [Chlamydomonas eustigma]